MPPRNIYAIGETVYDIVFRDGQPVSATPGGAMLNTAVSLGRLGMRVHLVSEVGSDRVGELVMAFLEKNAVLTDHVIRFNGQTALALAFLDEHENAHYSFWKNYPLQRGEIHLPVLQADDIVLFGSFHALSREVRKNLILFLGAAREAGAIILYDPNFRPSHASDLPQVRDLLAQNLDFADVVRGSHEDFRFLFNASGPDEAYRRLGDGRNKFLVYTEGGRAVSFRSARHTFSIGVPEVEPVSTIGAGDSFNAGVIYGLARLNVLRNQLPELKIDQWKAVLEGATTFGSIVCETYENYIPESFAKKLRRRR